jgi:hypothetical protein
VTIRRRAYDCFGADVAGRTGAIVHDHCPSETDGKPLTDQSSKNVVAATRRKRNNDRDIAGREFLRRGVGIK